MNTKAIIGIIIVIVIIGLIAVWLGKAPATTPPPTPVDTMGINSGASTVDTSTSTPTATPTATTSSAPATTPGTKVISTKTIDGMKIDVTKEGTGVAIKNGQTAQMLYTGKLTDGSVFDSTSKRNNEPLEFTLGSGMVIKGWDEGIVGMKVGEMRTLTIPAALAYGAEGRPPVIPANATLVFDVTLVGIK